MAPLLDSRESQYGLLYGLVDVSSQTKEKGANSLLFGQLYKRKYMLNWRFTRKMQTGLGRLTTIRDPEPLGRRLLGILHTKT
jgi:hypothetical protein